MAKQLEDAETQAAVKDAMKHYDVAVGDGQMRATACMQKIGKALKEHHCSLFPRVVLTPNGAEFMVECIPNPPGQSTGAGKKPAGYGLAPQGAPNAPNKKGKKDKTRNAKAVRRRKR